MATPSRDKALRAQRAYRRGREREARLCRWLTGVPALALAFLLMCGGVAWFTVSPSSLSYWLGGTLAATPFLWLVAQLAMREGWDSGPPDLARDLSGPWGPP
jgi:hypothetical protein